MEEPEVCSPSPLEGPSTLEGDSDLGQSRLAPRFLLRGWSFLFRVQQPLAWVWDSLKQACYYLVFTCRFAEDTESSVNDCSPSVSDWDSQVMDAPIEKASGCLQRFWHSFLGDWQTITGDQTPLTTAGKACRRYCKSLKRCWDSLTWRWRDPFTACFKSAMAPRVSSTRALSWNLVTWCLAPLPRCWNAVTRRSRSAARHCRALALVWGCGAWSGRCLIGSWRVAGDGWRTLGASCGWLGRAWSSLGRCWRALDRGRSLLGRCCRSLVGCLSALQQSPRRRMARRQV